MKKIKLDVPKKVIFSYGKDEFYIDTASNGNIPALLHIIMRNQYVLEKKLNKLLKNKEAV